MEVQEKIDELIALRASQWLDRLPAATESEREEFVRWLEESRANLQAFLEVSEIELGLHQVDAGRRENIDALLKQLAGNVVPLNRGTPRPRLRHRGRLIAALAAGVGFIAIAVPIAFRSFSPPQFTTAIGEQRTVELDDRSVVTLNAASRMRVDLRATERDVELREGEAIFIVAHDPKRPFRVYTMNAQVEAVGTQFNVYAKANGSTRVSVLEGRVRLLPRAGGSAQAGTLFLDGGEEAEIRIDGSVHRIPDAVVANAVAWRQRRLVFNDAWLEDMVTEFNRYNRNLQLKLEGVPEHSYQYDGIFDAADPQSFVDLLSKEPDLQIEREGADVFVRRRTP
ncbi:FecR family protein [Peristeroidobacter soli]|uniref:FecR family protein n=1 Tax=Peristeroidobacter soli TaxID=2497877 RepID=UPI001300590D|nr:FecR domain-containing protein [Peristeroidobacter soli]